MLIDGIKIKGITSNSNEVEKDYVFVAIVGEKYDGHNYIDAAVQKGAAIIYTEKDIYRDDCVIKKVENTRKTLAKLCNKFYNYPSKKLFVIGVTGTNGKTTTTNLIHHVVSSYGIKCGLISTLNIKINKEKYPSKLTTPATEDIYYYLNKMVSKDIKIAIIEVSSHGLKCERIYGIEFDIAIHTNIDRDHFNFHKTADDYIKSKKKLFDNLGIGKIALINSDDKYALNILKDNSNIFVITYGLSSKSTVNASSINIGTTTYFNYCLQRSIITLCGTEIQPFEYPIKLNLLGKHNIYNALSVITACSLLDIPIDAIASAIQSYKGVPRRMEIIYNDGYTVIDDFCHNPSSYEAVFKTVQNLQYKDLYIVNGIRGNRGKYINLENAKTLKQWYEILNVKKLIITNSFDCIDKDNRGNLDEKNSYLNIFKNSLLNIKYEPLLKNAILEVIKQIKSGDMILLLGAQSMNKGKNIFFNLLSKEEYITNM